MNENEVFPDNQQVRAIFRDTYNFYTKWIAVKGVNWDAFMSEVRNLEKTYPFELCRKILVELTAIIESKSMKEVENSG